ncbi:MAG: sulfite exporter TauE/SafE family protein [Pedobacter sp.]|nr:MAG: sulfite exporter TauE/SafE family protein [Pedobacter sp.]
MEIIGYVLAIIIGITLGLIGSGGSILTIPVLVYLYQIPPTQATAYSLFIVGAVALMGSLKGLKQKLVSLKIAFFFGFPSIISIFIMRKWLMPLFPDVFFTIGEWVVSKELFIMIIFSILMIIASTSMINAKSTGTAEENELKPPKLILPGFIIGFLTGFVGVGGGFLIIPSLVFKAKLPMRKAVATSLLIISVNALIGFTGSLGTVPIAWNFLLIFTGFALIGIFIGSALSLKIKGEKLKPFFGWFVLITGIYILIRELWF